MKKNIEKKAVIKNLDLKELKNRKLEKTKNLSMERHMDIQETAKNNFYKEIIFISDIYNNTYDKIILRLKPLLMKYLKLTKMNNSLRHANHSREISLWSVVVAKSVIGMWDLHIVSMCLSEIMAWVKKAKAQQVGAVLLNIVSENGASGRQVYR